MKIIIWSITHEHSPRSQPLTCTVYWPFADVRVNFLVSNKLDVLKQPDSPALKLSHVPVIMEFCMKNATDVEKPLGYMELLRTMFRALSGCKFELLLRDLI
ncbi:hypothetical protein TSUD_152720 [Trifolium subterraneum]|uniref:Uncharacterized protein n=1 Tax=Trifolium subterraneum TaxID=3900 RepID=A0A2Z6MN72_TRISU|nr:hypothetical protein TSUD_152720 [Trifolium subterraneum]